VHTQVRRKGGGGSEEGERSRGGGASLFSLSATTVPVNASISSTAVPWCDGVSVGGTESLLLQSTHLPYAHASPVQGERLHVDVGT
jgi:hypothetical protein